VRSERGVPLELSQRADDHRHAQRETNERETERDRERDREGDRERQGETERLNRENNNNNNTYVVSGVSFSSSRSELMITGTQSNRCFRVLYAWLCKGQAE
jgi:hypothetical protein